MIARKVKIKTEGFGEFSQQKKEKSSKIVAWLFFFICRQSDDFVTVTRRQRVEMWWQACGRGVAS